MNHPKTGFNLALQPKASIDGVLAPAAAGMYRGH